MSQNVRQKGDKEEMVDIKTAYSCQRARHL